MSQTPPPASVAALAELAAMEAAGADPRKVALRAFELETLRGITRPETAQAVMAEIKARFGNLPGQDTNAYKLKWMAEARLAPCFDAGWYEEVARRNVYGTAPFHKRAAALARSGVRGTGFDLDAMELAVITGDQKPKDFQAPNIAEFLKATKDMPGKKLAEISSHFGFSREIGKVLGKRKQTQQSMDFFAYAKNVWDLTWPDECFHHLLAVRGASEPPGQERGLDEELGEATLSRFENMTAPAEFWLWITKSKSRFMRMAAYRRLDFLGAAFEITLPKAQPSSTA